MTTSEEYIKLKENIELVQEEINEFEKELRDRYGEYENFISYKDSEEFEDLKKEKKKLTNELQSLKLN